MYRFALTLALSAAVLAPAVRTTSPTRTSKVTAPVADEMEPQRSGYIIASS